MPKPHEISVLVDANLDQLFEARVETLMRRHRLSRPEAEAQATNEEAEIEHDIEVLFGTEDEEDDDQGPDPVGGE